MPLVGYGLIFSLWWAIPGVVLVIAGVYGWVMEPSTDPDAGHHHDDHDDHDDDPESAAAELTEGDADAEGTDRRRCGDRRRRDDRGGPRWVT